jgi:NAD(P) transhydrogenase subunit alpha
MRVATTPEVAAQLQKTGIRGQRRGGAGAASKFSDDAFRAAGATIVTDTRALWAESDIILKVRPPARHPRLGVDEVDLLREGQVFISFLWPAQQPDLLKQLAAKGVTTLAMDSVPRISRAQKMDALSSMANIAGYRAVIEAAEHFGRFFTGQITAGGRIPPAKVLVIGAGVAGLAAIGTAKSLGAIVRAFDTRPEVKEQVESMDGEFLMLDFKEEGAGVGGYAKVMSPEFIKAEMALFAAQAKEVDIIITTALIPGQARAEAHYGRHGPLDARRQRHRRSRRRARRQLRIDRARPGRHTRRRDDHRLHGSAEPAGHTIQPALRHQPAPPADGHVSEERRRARGRFRR